MEKDPRVDLCIDWEYKDLVQNHPVLYQLLIERIAIAYQNKYGFPMENRNFSVFLFFIVIITTDSRKRSEKMRKKK